MLQEFLAALHGFNGDIFVEDDNGNIKIIEELPFIVPTEQSLMNEVCILGSYYKKMQKFIQKFSNPLINKDISGLYKVTFAHAVNNALDTYRNDLMDIQKKLLIDEFLSVSFIKWRLNEYFVLFPVLWNIMSSIINASHRGCQILDIIYRNIPIGSTKVRIVLNEILKRCNQVFYHQLSAWLLRGALFDPYKEFFIEPLVKEIDIKSDNKVSTEPILIDNMTKSELNSHFYDGVDRKRASGFRINVQNIPCFIPISLGNKILFIGDAVHFFDRDRRNIVVNDWSEGIEGGNQLKNELSTKYIESLQNLRGNDEFNLLRLQELVEDVEGFVRKRMWDLLVRENLFLESCFSDVKDFFLLGRGELFMEFILGMERTLIGRDYNSAMEGSINAEFLRASHAVLFDKDDTICKFRFVIDKKKDGEKLKWENISMTYAVSWPFHILFTKEILATYNDVFKFLMMLKRTQMHLYQGLDRKKFRGMAYDQQCLMRNQMNFLFNNLQYYLQVDVIESQTSVFHKKVLLHEDIEQLKHLHEALIHSLKVQSFLFDRTISSGFVNLADSCIRYCDLVQLAADDTSTSDDAARKLEQMREKLQSLSALLYNILSNVEDQLTSNPHLRQLLLRLDFNNFFSVIGVAMGSLKKSSHSAARTFNV